MTIKLFNDTCSKFTVTFQTLDEVPDSVYHVKTSFTLVKGSQIFKSTYAYNPCSVLHKVHKDSHTAYKAFMNGAFHQCYKRQWNIGYRLDELSTYIKEDMWRLYKSSCCRAEKIRALLIYHFNNTKPDSDRPYLPSTKDILQALLCDAEVLHFANFEEWASEYGYDTDSIKAKCIYDQCLKTGTSLSSMIGLATIEKLHATIDKWEQ